MIIYILITAFVSLVFVFGIVAHNTMHSPLGFENDTGFHLEARNLRIYAASTYSGPERRAVRMRVDEWVSFSDPTIAADRERP
jgi:hypothetical protein